MLGKVSSKLRGNSTSLQRNCNSVERCITTDTVEGDNTPGSSHGSRSTQRNREARRRRHKERGQLALDSLRERLKAELGPELSTDVLHQSQLAQQIHDNPTQETGAKYVSTPGIQRVSRKWNNEDPFQTSAGWATKSSKGYEHTGHKDLYGSQGGESADPNTVDKFAEVALASVPGIRRVYTNSGSGPTVANSSQEERGMRSGNDGIAVVVANAECVLEHPRPSRQSEQEMIKVLCKEVSEDSEDHQDRPRKSEVSGGSSASYHTAPVIISVS